MLKKPALTLLFTSVILLSFLYYRSAANIEWLDAALFSYRNSVIEPLEFLTLFLIPISLYLLIFNPTIQQSWWRWARFALLVPFAVIVLMLPTYQNGGGFVTFGGTTDLVILWGVIFALATLIHTLYQRWYRKTGV